ncbi:MAG: serine/threonine-protein kinase [Candidatus Cryptobacteroides sp.]|nr:serine/threonine-protein kinase [Bacteroidales bacterium]MDY5263286.1 serine/threonine-protein kinase [Candidatus Cryptobacteroides sp.]MDY6183443.1 serine/threonine-protein kinase [Candidatus Cryptobacteroides sp.]
MEEIRNSGFFGPEGTVIEDETAPLEEIGRRDGPFILYKSSRHRRIVAIKCVRPEFRDNPLYWDMLRKEYEIGHSLNHPNIREYYSLDNDPELGICLEMEWVDGDSLDQLLPECRRNAELRDKIARQILDAVRFMHLKQVIHRDLKPGNILVTRNGQNVKLIDFSLSDSDSHLVLKGNAGTARYASPEQKECGPADFRSDIFSIGVILSEMSDSRRYRNVSRKCMRPDKDRRYPDIDRLEAALFPSSYHGLGLIAAAVIIALAVSALWMFRQEEPEEEDIDIEAIDEIFRQATDLVEESDSTL